MMTCTGSHARGSGQSHTTTDPETPLLNTTTEQHLRINRRHRRVEVELPCEVGLPGETLTTVRLLNLSVGGLKFECGLQQVNQLLPEEQRTPGMVMDVVLDVRLKLKTGGNRAPTVSGKARLAHYERLAQDRFHVGIEYIELEKTQQRKLEDYVNDNLDEPQVVSSEAADE
jgi:hypothetical protein